MNKMMIVLLMKVGFCMQSEEDQIVLQDMHKTEFLADDENINRHLKEHYEHSEHQTPPATDLQFLQTGKNDLKEALLSSQPSFNYSLSTTSSLLSILNSNLYIINSKQSIYTELITFVRSSQITQGLCFNQQEQTINFLKHHSIFLVFPQSKHLYEEFTASLFKQSQKNIESSSENGEIIDSHNILFSETQKFIEELLRKAYVVKTSDVKAVVGGVLDKASRNKYKRKLLRVYEMMSESGNLSRYIRIIDSYLLVLAHIDNVKDIGCYLAVNGRVINKEFTEDDLIERTDSYLTIAQLEAADIEGLRLSYADNKGDIVLNSADIQKELNEWDDLLNSMDSKDTVVIGTKPINLSQAKEEVVILENTLKHLEDSKKVLIISDGEVSFKPPIVTNSEALSNKAFEALSEASANYHADIPIISTTESSGEIQKGDGSVTILLSEAVNSTELAEIDTEPEGADSLYLESFRPAQAFLNDIEYLILTTFITNEAGTGKVWVMPLKDPSKTYLLLEGFQAPLGTCFDSAHRYLYIVDQGVSAGSGSIFQYRLSKEDTLELSNDIYAEIYIGNPSDCKIDSYGNIYFTDSLKNTINIISFPDLFSGFNHKDLAIYSNTKLLHPLSQPWRLDFAEDEIIYYVNKETGSLNQAEMEVEGLNEAEIDEVAKQKGQALGVTIGSGKVFYSLDSGEIRAFDKVTLEDTLISKDFFVSPRGMCYADEKIYVADHGKGALYTIDAQGGTPQLIAHIQAIEGVHCIEFVMLLEVLWVIFIIN